MAKYYKINSKPFCYEQIAEYKTLSEKDRGLDDDCREGGKHSWLLLPQQRGQKQYLYCLKCGEYNHL